MKRKPTVKPVKSDSDKEKEELDGMPHSQIGPHHVSYWIARRVPVSERPKVTAMELASLVVESGRELANYAETARLCLNLVWECAAIISEQKSSLPEFDARLAAQTRQEELRARYTDTSKPPMGHEEFIRALNIPKDGLILVRNGSRVKGKELFRAYVREHKLRLDLPFIEEKGWFDREEAMYCTIGFREWYKERVTANKVRTRKNLNK
ncbi:MAG: hypothetical protein EBS68_08740 [Rhodobacteraceae bacterium]|nr:hypothetical protein [Paracoccaceae bacterium]